MLRLAVIKSQLSRRWVVQLLLVVLAIVAFLSWKWLLDRSLQNERDAWSQRLRVQQEEQLEVALERVREELERERDDCVSLLEESSSVSSIRNLVTNYALTAIVVPESEYEVVNDEGIEFDDVVESEVVSWASDEEGRDALAARLILFSADERIWQLLSLRFSGEEGPPMKPSFRHWLIEEAKKVRGEMSLELEALSQSEKIRAGGVAPEKGISFSGDEGVLLWWSEEAILRLFKERGVNVRLSRSGKDLGLWDNSWRIQLDELPNFEQNSDTLFGFPRLYAVGILSGVGLLLALAFSLWLSDHEHKLARLRTDLAASVAHELRTPLAGQRILLESLSAGLEQTNEEKANYLEMSLKENRRLGSLVEQFLTFSRLERGKLSLQGQEVSLLELVEEVVADWRVVFSQLEVDVLDGERAWLDLEAVQTILRNLVENACKYSSAPKSLAISVKRREEYVLFSVGDSAPGLTAREKRRVFRKFWRSDQMLSRRTEGLGLGLFIVSSLAQAHGGEVQVSDSRLGGANFEVTLRELK